MRQGCRAVRIGKAITWRALLVAAAALTAAANPRAEPLPLPADIVGLNSTRGEVLLEHAEARGDYVRLNAHFEAQSNPAFCGPASIAMVLNALEELGRGSFDQESVFNARAEAVKPRAEVRRGGMTLDELGGVLEAHDVQVEVRHAADSSLEEFRWRAAAALERDQEYVLVNYLRREIGQKYGGHISPLAAYDVDSDRFLVLDVSRDRYPPAWVRTAALFEAMNTPDRANDNRTRGFLIVGRE